MTSRIEFEDLLSSATYAWNQQDYEGAVAILERIPATLKPEWRSQVFYFLGMVRRDYGDLEGSLRDFENGLALSAEKSFGRYHLQVAIGEHFESIQQGSSALRWYREAINSCVEGSDFSGNTALSSFLRLCNGKIPRQDLRSVEAALVKSWRVLDLPPDKLDLSDVSESIERLEAGISNQFEQIING